MNNPAAGITAVILASGFSKRMGCNKLLLPVEGKAMIAHVFDAVRQVKFEQTVVVTGFDSIAQLAVGHGFQAVDNDSPEIRTKPFGCVGGTEKRHNRQDGCFLMAICPG